MSEHASPFEALNQATRALLDSVRRAGFPPMHTQSVAQARQSYRMGVGVSQSPAPAMARTHDFSIPSPQGHGIAARLWAPTADTGLPVLLYFHGGGFVIGGIDTCEVMCKGVAQAAGVAVVAIDYRLAPEHPWPAGLDDAWTALQWLHREGHTLGLDGGRIAVAGDSAGGTLTATCALLARDAGLPLRLQAMFYPSVQTSQVTASFREFAQGLMLDAELMKWFDRHTGMGGPQAGWQRQPLHADSHAGLAPAWIGLAECDPLADDGRLYAQALEKAGVPVALTVYQGTVHDFINMGRFLPQAGQAHADLAAAVKKALAA